VPVPTVRSTTANNALVQEITPTALPLLEQFANVRHLSPAIPRSANLSTSHLPPQPHRSPHLSMVSTFPPTQCGLATFAAASRTAMLGARPTWDIEVIQSLKVNGEPSARPAQLGSSKGNITITKWVAQSSASMRRATAALQQSDCVIIQHEYGIFGGEDGAEILTLLQDSSSPTIAVLHTVLDRPSLGQRRVIGVLSKRCSSLIVMSESARERLLRRYPVDPQQVVVIPHGAHPVPYRAPLSSGGRPQLLTWGLVGPGKGLERAIDAIAMLRAHSIDADYLICGETHPNVRASEGERYRNALIERTHMAGVADLVTFDSQYRSVNELIPVIENADIVLIPYDTREQVTSGVLVEALAAGKPVIATAFPHAVEALATGAGVAVSHDDPRAIFETLLRVLTDSGEALRMSREAMRIGKKLLWPAVGESLASLVEQTIKIPGTGPECFRPIIEGSHTREAVS
jgi:polysaccharide biosynthesis protein PslF